MTVLDTFFDTPMAFGISGLALFMIGLLIKQHRGRKLVLTVSLFLYARYMLWRLLYTIPTDDIAAMVLGSVVYFAELYGLCQFCFYTYQSWSPTERTPPPITTYPTVDIMVTVVDEPLSILRQTLLSCLAQEYPRDRFTVYVLDDGHRVETQQLADSLGCEYIRRPDKPRHAKAGNLNHALHVTHGELVAIFDVDHIPARTFLKDTVGFFDDPKVAIVQTPHHFYNPDIFQRNLRVGDEVKNEQALFFRSLQAGRDTHNSAFFAGSSGLLRRQPLMEIGGFQTQTITEDIHTSMNLHARGYRSCYLNKVLSAGLMPETFDGYLKQRKRWAMGCIQVLLRDNPLTKRGLTLAQRIDYFGSIFYFFFGLPRLICLIAPLASLLFSMPPLKADVLALTNYFFSFFLASALVMRPVSRGSRNPFWSDVYEVAMCFALTVVALKALAAPRKERPFEVTPKGQRVKKSSSTELSLAWPHLVTFGLLVVGLALGTWNWWQDTGDPGLPVSLFWGSINLLLLTVALFVAREQAQVRQGFRLKRDFAGQLFVDGEGVPARVVDVSERGTAVTIGQPIFTLQKSVKLVLTSSRGLPLPVTAHIIRQDPIPSGGVHVGLQFDELDSFTRQILVDKMYGDPAPWEESYRIWPGIRSSLRSLFQALTVPLHPLTWNRRSMIRVKGGTQCLVTTPTSVYKGQVGDMSFTGLSAIFSESSQDSLLDSLLELPGVTLKVSPIRTVRTERKMVVHFQVISIESGEDEWHSLHNAQWRVAQQEIQAALKRSSLDHSAQDLPLEGETLNLNEQSLAVVLPKAVFADLDQVQVMLTTQDGSLFNLTGCVVRQHQTRIGEVVIGIQLAESSGKTTISLIEKYQYPELRGFRWWLQILLGQPSARPAERRRMPRLPIHTTCAILSPDMAPSWRTTPNPS
ncbi:MAG: glycosyltransferase [Nitrospirae bacterium]|nr:glycosyltransferase [Nitrospirota bacterium]